MLEQIESPENVLAVRAVGTVDRADYETVLEPAVDAMLATHGELRFVYVLGDEFDNYSAGADWEDVKFGFTHLNKWKKCGIVTDKDWIRHAVAVFGPLSWRAAPVRAERDRVGEGVDRGAAALLKPGRWLG